MSVHPSLEGVHCMAEGKQVLGALGAGEGGGVGRLHVSGGEGKKVREIRVQEYALS